MARSARFRSRRDAIAWTLLGVAFGVILWFGGTGAFEGSKQRRAQRREELSSLMVAEVTAAGARFQRLVEASRSGDLSDLPPGFVTELAAYRPSSSESVSANLAKAERLEFVRRQPREAELEYSRLGRDESVSPDTRVLALWNEARLRRERDDLEAALETLQEATRLDGVSASARIRVAFDLARLGVDRERFLGWLVAASVESSFVGVDPGERWFLHRELGGDVRSASALRALDALLRGVDTKAVVSFAESGGARIVAWLMAATDGNFELVLGSVADLLSSYVPGLNDGRWRLLDSAATAGGVTTPTLPGRFALGPAADRELDRVARAALLQRSLWVGAAALLLVLGMLYQRLVTRRRLLLEERKSNFICAVTHELKTPLSNIMLYAETLREASADDPEIVPRFSRTILDEAERLRLRIQQVLDVAAGRSREADQSRLFDPAEVVEAVVADYRFGAGDQGFSIELDRPRDCPSIRGPSEFLAQAVGGLIDNAIKFAGGGVIRVRMLEVERRIVIFVSDQGPGVPDADIDRIFEPFVRLEPEMTRRASGTGLGLTLVRQCVEAFGGTVELLPSDAGGALFRIVLPVEESKQR